VTNLCGIIVMATLVVPMRLFDRHLLSIHPTSMEAILIHGRYFSNLSVDFQIFLTVNFQKLNDRYSNIFTTKIQILNDR
jgi:hypothetical protein